MAAKTLQQAVTEFQTKNPYSSATWQQIVPYLNAQGFNVAYATHAANSQVSTDAIVDASSGKVYDLAIDGGAGGWSFQDKGTYDPSRSIVGPNGQFQKYSDWAKQYQSTSSTSGTPSTQTGTADPSQGGTVLGGYQPIVMGQGGVPSNFGPNTRLVKSVIDKVNQAKYKVNAQQTSDPYAAAARAAAQARASANRGGRRSTILGGFGSGAPSTRRATVLGY